MTTIYDFTNCLHGKMQCTGDINIRYSAVVEWLEQLGYGAESRRIA